MNEHPLFIKQEDHLWHGDAFLHLQVETKWSLEFECFLLDKGLPISLGSPCREATKIAKVVVTCAQQPRFQLAPGCEFGCRASLSFHNDRKHAFVSKSCDMWPLAQHHIGRPCSFVHLCSGAFNGWTQAERGLSILNFMPTPRMTLAVDWDPVVCKAVSATQGSVIINPEEPVIPNVGNMVICMDVANPFWVGLINSCDNIVCTLSFPCPPFSKGGRKSGLEAEEGRVVLQALSSIRLLQPVCICIENVDSFGEHPHASMVWRFCKWAGYELVWKQTHHLNKISHCYRSRFLAVLMRHDLDTSKVRCVFNPVCRTIVSWDHPKHCFDLPVIVEDDLKISQELMQCYANPAFLPVAKQKMVRDHTPRGVLMARVPSSVLPLATLVSNYSMQHLLPIKHLLNNNAGIFAELRMLENGNFAFFDPPRWLALLGNISACILPPCIQSSFAIIGNAIAVPHAVLTLCVAINQLNLYNIGLPVEEIVAKIWEFRLDASNSVFDVTENGFGLYSIGDYLMLGPVIRKSFAVHDHPDFVLSLFWPDYSWSDFQCNKSQTCTEILRKVGFSEHHIHRWAFVSKDGKQVFRGGNTFWSDHHACNIVFIHPSADELQAKRMSEVPTDLTCVWTQYPADLHRANPPTDMATPMHMCDAVTELDPNEACCASAEQTRDVKCLPLAHFAVETIAEVPVEKCNSVEDQRKDHRATSSDSSIECIVIQVITISGEQVSLECIPLRTVAEIFELTHQVPFDDQQVESFVDHLMIQPDAIISNLAFRTIEFRRIKKRKTISEFHAPLLEVTSLDGLTRFLPTTGCGTIRETLLASGFPENMVRCMKASCGSKLLSLDLQLIDLPSPHIRLQCFPLRGGGRGSSKGKDAKDGIFINDPWAIQPKAVASTRWDQLQLLDKHPWHTQDGTRLKQVPFLQLGTQCGGVSFATKAQLKDIVGIKPPTPTVILLPGLRDVSPSDISIQGQTLPAQQTVVKEPSTGKQYKRMVLPFVIAGEIKYQVEASESTPSVEKAAFCEMVMEIQSNMCSATISQALDENPLDFFRKTINTINGSSTEMSVYAYRKIKSSDGTFVHQTLLKVRDSCRIDLLKLSGNTELFLRQFVENGQTLDHSIVPRYWPITLAEARQARQLGLSLADAFVGLALTPKGIAIRVLNKAIAAARDVILQGDIRFTSENRHVIPTFVFLAQGFPFEISHEGIIKAVTKAVGQPPVPLRNFRLAGMLTWVLGFETRPSETHFVVQIGTAHHEILLTPQELQNKLKAKGRGAKTPKNPKNKTFAEPSWHPPPASFPGTQSNQSLNDKRIQTLEDKVLNLETKQDQLSTQQNQLTQKVDTRFDEVALQLQQVLKAVTGNPSQPSRSREPTGETPPPKQVKTS